MASKSQHVPGASPNDAKLLIDATIGRLKDAIHAEADKFFPHGIEVIELTVKVPTIEVALRVAGPKIEKALSGTGLTAM